MIHADMKSEELVSVKVKGDLPTIMAEAENIVRAIFNQFKEEISEEFARKSLEVMFELVLLPLPESQEEADKQFQEVAELVERRVEVRKNG